MGHAQRPGCLILAFRHRLKTGPQHLANVCGRDHAQRKRNRDEVIHKPDFKRQGNAVTEREEDQQGGNTPEDLDVQGGEPPVGCDGRDTHERQQQPA